MMDERKILRCAVYTRKSTEEGLDMDYNTLDAQREAGEKYIEALRGEGWRLIPEAYDDGGYSGGNMDRPALKRLIEDIKANRIDIVVVYKVDRLSRSLADFAKLVEILDAHGTSFVSVTQHFNTKDSMGRLTLNILLSFAQFEREVTGERIRDKFAASKKKGMWMGGPPPLGYDVADRKLITNPKEIALVKHIFERYCALQSMTLLGDELRRDGHRTKCYVSRTDNRVGGRLFTINALRTLLRNRLYLGEVHHRGKYYPGQHQAIIPQALFDRAQEVFTQASKVKRRHTTAIKSKSLLMGLLVCGGCGGVLSPHHTRKGNKHYHYYVSNSYRRQFCKDCPARRLPAGDIEAVVSSHLQGILHSPQMIVETWRNLKTKKPDVTEMEVYEALTALGNIWNSLFIEERNRIVRLLIERVVVRAQGIDIEYRAEGLEEIVNDLQRKRPDQEKVRAA